MNLLLQEVIIINLDGVKHYCDLLVFATGAWTASLLPQLDYNLNATGQPVIHLKVPKHLEEKYSSPKFAVFAADIEKTGIYGFPCTNGVIKIATHGSGYINPINSISTPKTIKDDENISIPSLDIEKFRIFCAENFPDIEFNYSTRLCWYSDSFDSDFVICNCDGYDNIVIASGGSGHAFKFTPILGELVGAVVVETLNRVFGDSLECGKVLKRFGMRYPTDSSKRIEKTRNTVMSSQIL